jgi:endonuclease III
MDLKALRQNFKIYMQERFPNDKNISSTVSMAFFLDRHGFEIGFDFNEILITYTIPETYKRNLEKYFVSKERKDPRGNALVYERSLRLLLEFLNEQDKSAPLKITDNKTIIRQREILTISCVPHEIEPVIDIGNQSRDCEAAGKLLVKIGNDRFSKKEEHPWVHLTGNHEYDKLLNDLDNTPHAFVLACLMDKQIKAERAWAIPCIIMDNFGIEIEKLNLISFDEYITFFNQRSLHRFNNEMAKVFKSGVERIIDYYDGDASIIWGNKPSSARVVYDFLQFRGAGIKIATMAANILARQFQIEFADYYSIDVSPDIHICRVMWRMGLIEDENNTDSAIYRARELNPEFPGIIDFSAWEIGREYCRPTNPKCNSCYVRSECIKRLN